MNNYFLQSGHIFVSGEPYLIQTVLGSCIAVCIWDKEEKIGAMNHYLLPRANNNLRTANFGDVSIPYLIRMLKQFGSDERDWEISVFGGASSKTVNSDVGSKNIQVALEYFSAKNLKIKRIETGGQFGRKIYFDNTTGEIEVNLLNSMNQ